MNFERFFGAPGRSTRFCRKILEKGSTQDGGIVVIYKAESQKSLFRQTAEKAGFGTHLPPFWEGFGCLLANFGAKRGHIGDLFRG